MRRTDGVDEAILEELSGDNPFGAECHGAVREMSPSE